MGSETLVLVAIGICSGVAATVTMDVLGIISNKIGLIAGVKGEWVGRWYLYIAKGKFVHTDIEAVPELTAEKLAALIGHYLIGIILAVVYIFGAGWIGFSPGALFVALGYGVATCVFPWFLMFPALGFGVFGIKAPRKLKLFRTSLINHTFYGFGLWWSIKVLPVGNGF